MRSKWLGLFLGVLLMANPVLVRYVLGDTTLEIPAHYEGGLEGALTPGIERMGVRFRCPDPLWRHVLDEAAILTVSQSLNVSYLVAKVDGTWTNLGNAGTGTVYAIAQGPDKKIYVGGDFTDWDGITGADYIAVWNGANWAKVGSASDINWIVWGMAFDASGDLYVGGQFTNAGGDADADYIAKWDGVSWSAVGAPASGGASVTSIRSVVQDQNGDIVVGGFFTDLAGVSAADGVAKWDGSSWSALGNGLGGGGVHDLAIDSNNHIYAGGSFTTRGDSTDISDSIAKWDGSSWESVGDDFDAAVLALELGSGETVYAAGLFAANGSTSLDHIARWNGIAWGALGGGINSDGYSIELLSDGRLLVGGNFTQAGGLSIGDRVALWNGSVWNPLSIDLPGSPIVRAVRELDGDIYLGFTTTGTAYASDTTINLTNSGSAPAYPIIKIKRSGGTSATLESIINETSGKQLLFNLSLQDGETITIDLRPGIKTITSDSRGNLLGKLLPNSDLATWALLSGEQDVSVYVSDAGSPTVTATFQWTPRYWSCDDAGS